MKLRARSLVGFLVAASAAADTNLLTVWDFDSRIVNNLGGGYNQFSAPPSEASIHFASDVHRGPAGRSMKIVYRKADTGYCGMWMHLFDETADPAGRKLLDATQFPFLSLWVKGAKGGEDFVIQMADENWLKKDDSKPAGPASKYLGAPLTTNWQEVVVPVSDFGLDAAKLAGLTLNFTSNGEGVVYVDDVSFRRAADTPVSSSVAAGLRPAQTRAAGTAAATARAMWVWEINELLAESSKRDELLSFCNQQNINELFLQVAYGFAETNPPKVYLKEPDALCEFLCAANAAGIRVHAMDGYPEYALRAFHPEVLALVNAVVDYNEASAPEERFHGIHLDNEPYQLLGFDGPERESILIQLLELNEKIMALLKERKTDLVYGVDIPFWLDEKDADGNVRGLVTYKGARKDAAKHILDIVDNVGVMDYRNFAGGVDGIIYHGLGEVEYAAKIGKRIYIGVETFKYEPTPVTFLFGMPEKDWQALQNGTAGCVLSSRVDGFQVRTFTDGERRYIGLAERVPMPDRAAYEAALKKLYSLYGATAGGCQADPDQMAAAAFGAMRKNTAYKGLEQFRLKDENDAILAAGFTTSEVMLPKITFAGKSKKHLEDVLREVGEFFETNPGFGGIAIHHYTTYRAMKD